MKDKFKNTKTMFAIGASVGLVVALVLIGILTVDSDEAKTAVMNRGFDLGTLVISGILAKVVLGSINDDTQKQNNETEN